MAIERLSFGSESQYNAIELAIHLARYSTAQNLCQNLKVLDVACGEGYGSYAMAAFWNAAFVTGVDISEEAIENAQKVFSHPNVEYISSPAENIDTLFEPESFDLVISLETIEHVKDPGQFLSAIRKVLKPDGIAIISCPNDHWYYGPGESQNPFHLRTYYFDEFRQLAETYLGEANYYLFGRPLNGFGNFLPVNDALSGRKMTAELNNAAVRNVNLISTDQNISAEDSSYFIGVWGKLPVKKEELVNCVFFPVSMDKFSITLEDLNAALKSRVSLLEGTEKQNEELKTELQNHANRISELEKWTVELQSALRNSENRALDLEKWSRELQSELSQANNQLEFERLETEKMQSENNALQLANNNLQMEIENRQQLIESAQNTIEAMESSRFWKLRNEYFKLKNAVSVKDKK